jgi:hypothetical protein
MLPPARSTTTTFKDMLLGQVTLPHATIICLCIIAAKGSKYLKIIVNIDIDLCSSKSAFEVFSDRFAVG